MLTPEQLVILEGLIDADDLPGVLVEIAGICFGKAEHLSHHWQDHRTAAIWMAAGKAIDRVAGSDAVKATAP